MKTSHSSLYRLARRKAVMEELLYSAIVQFFLFKTSFAKCGSFGHYKHLRYSRVIYMNSYFSLGNGAFIPENRFIRLAWWMCYGRMPFCLLNKNRLEVGDMSGG